MPEAPGRLIPRSSFALVLTIAAAIAACNATGATPIPPPATATGAPATATTAPGGSGPTALSTTVFSVPFSLTLPTGWEVFDEQPDMFAAYVSTDNETADVNIDIQVVPKVNLDPCDKDAGTATGGSTAAELSTWMLAYAPLKGSAGTATTIDGSKALVVDEAFAGTPCVNPVLWPTDGGWLDASEHKRYFVFEVGGKRLVATIISSDAKFDSHVDAALAVLASLRFTT